MSEFDALEKELVEMHPRQPSDRLKARIAERLASSSPSSIKPASRSVQRRVAIIGGLVAACLAAIFVWRQLFPRVESGPPESSHDLLLATTFDTDFPSVWSYRNALIRSSDSLDALLDQHSGDRRSNPEQMHVHAFARLDSTFNDLLGEL